MLVSQHYVLHLAKQILEQHKITLIHHNSASDEMRRETSFNALGVFYIKLTKKKKQPLLCKTANLADINLDHYDVLCISVSYDVFAVIT
jgi:hypothetical protein